MDPADIAPVHAFKDRIPKTMDDLKKMLGFLSYYCPFIPNFSCTAKPLYSLLATEKKSRNGVKEEAKK